MTEVDRLRAVIERIACTNPELVAQAESYVAGRHPRNPCKRWHQYRPGTGKCTICGHQLTDSDR